VTLVAGIDCSTQSTKALIVDLESGEQVAIGRASHEVFGTGGARESDPEGWWTALRDAIAMTGMASEVGAISVAGQQHGMVVLDSSGRPLRAAKLWNDTESAPDAAALTEAFGGADWWANRIGLVPVASFTATKWAWLRRMEPAVAAATAAIRLPHDFVTERLSGIGASDRGDASGTAWWSTETGEYAAAVLEHELIQMDPALLPKVLGPDERAGTVTKAASEFLGIPEGIPVGPGTGDNAGAAVGLGLESGVPVISLGTSGTAFMVSESRIIDPTGMVAGFADATGRFLPLAATLNCTVAVDRIAGWLGLDREEVAEDTGVVVLPYFDGERTPNLPHSAGTIVGLRHTTEPREILLAAYRGAVVGLLDALDVIDSRSSGIADDAPVVVVGGGAKGETWRRIVGQMTGRAVQIPDNTELVALGAAAQAAAMVTGEAPDAVARRWDTRKGTTLDPVTRDDEARSRIDRVRELTAELNQQRLG
jgi:xylulokinase